MRRLKTRLRAEEGMTLIELLIAITIMSVGIAALVAGFSTGIVSIQRANVTSTAGTLADQQMETFRQGSYATVQSKPGAPIDGPDGHKYWIQSDVSLCSASTGPAASCSAIPASRPVKLVTIEVRDGLATGKLLFTESTTFDASTG
jgi:prepilin-type N-terminal cleavage/methylation domain-containing protein